MVLKHQYILSLVSKTWKIFGWLNLKDLLCRLEVVNAIRVSASIVKFSENHIFYEAATDKRKMNIFHKSLENSFLKLWFLLKFWDFRRHKKKDSCTPPWDVLWDFLGNWWFSWWKSLNPYKHFRGGLVSQRYIVVLLYIETSKKFLPLYRIMSLPLYTFLLCIFDFLSFQHYLLWKYIYIYKNIYLIHLIQIPFKWQFSFHSRHSTVTCGVIPLWRCLHWQTTHSSHPTQKGAENCVLLCTPHSQPGNRRH